MTWEGGRRHEHHSERRTGRSPRTGGGAAARAEGLLARPGDRDVGPESQCQGEAPAQSRRQEGRPDEGRLPVQGEPLVQLQTLAKVLLLGVEGVQLGYTGPVFLPLMLPVRFYKMSS